MFGEDFDFDGDQDGNQNEDCSGKSDEEVKEDRRLVKPKIQNRRPRLKLDTQRLTGNRGIRLLESVCNNISFKGKGHELRDLNTVMTHLEHWAHCLFPKMTFDDFLDNVEDLGSKKAVITHLTKIRLGMEDNEMDSEDRHVNDTPAQEDSFDNLVGKQPNKEVTEDMRRQIERNRLLAAERLINRLKKRILGKANI